MSDIGLNKIAYVDTSKLIINSNTVKQAQNIRDMQTKEMLKWYDNANNEIQKQQTKEAKEALIKKYEKELTQKKQSIKDNYIKEVKKADSQMNNIISKKANELGYSIVFKKDALLFGGNDITSQILPSVK